MNKLLSRSALSVIGGIMFVVLYGMVSRTPTIGLLIAVAVCLKITGVLDWVRGAKYGAVVGAISYTFVVLIKGALDDSVILMEVLWAIPITGVIIGGVLGAIFGAAIGKLFEMQKTGFFW